MLFDKQMFVNNLSWIRVVALYKGDIQYFYFSYLSQRHMLWLLTGSVSLR